MACTISSCHSPVLTSKPHWLSQERKRACAVKVSTNGCEPSVRALFAETANERLLRLTTRNSIRIFPTAASRSVRTAKKASQFRPNIVHTKSPPFRQSMSRLFLGSHCMRSGRPRFGARCAPDHCKVKHNILTPGLRRALSLLGMDRRHARRQTWQPSIPSCKCRQLFLRFTLAASQSLLSGTLSRRCIRTLGATSRTLTRVSYIRQQRG